MDGMKKREKLENQKLENQRLEKTWKACSALAGGENPWNGFGRRLRRLYEYGFGLVDERLNSLIG